LAALWRGGTPIGTGARWLLRVEGLIAGDGVLTGRGREAAREAARTEGLWRRFMHDRPEDAFALSEYWSGPIEAALPADTVRALEGRSGLREVGTT
jgi:hypothetical protein